ncbi:MAG TPA: hypothetical protein VJJ20_02310 [Candidatus Paceibacterota bacterium]
MTLIMIMTGVAISGMLLLWGIAQGLRDLWKHRKFYQAMNKVERAGELYFRWREARPFLFVGQSPYAQSLIIEMLRQYEYAGSLFAYICPNQEWVMAWRRILHEMPPEYDPSGPALRGHSFLKTFAEEPL